MKKLIVAVVLLLAGCATPPKVEKHSQPAVGMLPMPEDHLKSKWRVVDIETGRVVDLKYDGCYVFMLDENGIGLSRKPECQPWK